MDSLGIIPMIMAMLKNYDPITQRKIILREMIFALGVMIFFLFFGDDFLELLGISRGSMQVAGGIILFGIAVKMVFGITTEKTEQKQPFIVPLAVPTIAGPGMLTMISIYSALSPNNLDVLLALLIAWGLSLPIVLLSSFLKKIIGQNGLLALEKLFGYVIVLLSVQVILNGIFSAFHLQAT